MMMIGTRLSNPSWKQVWNNTTNVFPVSSTSHEVVASSNIKSYSSVARNIKQNGTAKINGTKRKRSVCMAKSKKVKLTRNNRRRFVHDEIIDWIIHVDCHMKVNGKVMIQQDYTISSSPMLTSQVGPKMHVLLERFQVCFMLFNLSNEACDCCQLLCYGMLSIIK